MKEKSCHTYVSELQTISIENMRISWSMVFKTKDLDL